MRIGIDTHAAERGGGGNCTYITNLVCGLAEIDTENHYVLLATDPTHPFYQLFNGRSNFSVHRVVSSPSWWRVFLSLCRASYAEHLDLIHVQYFAPFIQRGALVNTVHDMSPFRFPKFYSLYERFIFNLLLPGSSKRSNLVITATSFAKDELLEILPVNAGKVRVIPHGIDEKFRETLPVSVREQTVKKYGIEGPYILTVGRIDPRKNLHRLLDAHSLLVKRHSIQQKLLIVGKDYFLPPVVKSALDSAREKKEVVLLGFVADEDLPALYQGADAFVYLSEYEGFGLPPLEAMASGTPVVASDIAVFEETLGNAAILVNPYKIEEICNSLFTILSDERLRESLRENGKIRAERYRWNKAAEATLAAYREAVDGSRKSGGG